MKKLIIALGFLGFFGIGVEAAHAYECSYLLKNSHGQTVKVVKGRDHYSFQNACFDAQRGCQREADRSYSYGMYCVAERGHNGGGYGNGGYSRCTVELVDRWGYRIRTFQGYSSGGYNGGYNVPNNNPSMCRDALRECNRYKMDYNYHGARCQTRR
jgi:hypothetical protein